MKLRRKLFALLALSATLFFQSCNEDSPTPITPGAEGFFIINEGGYPNENSSISFYDRQTTNVTNNIFQSVNGRSLGLQAQSMTVFEGKGYIVVQGSKKIEVIDASDYSSLATITEDLENPRYVIGISTDKAYVSDWGADGLTGSVKVLDLNSYQIMKSISTGSGPNKMLRIGNKVYVANSGGYGKDNTVKVIDTSTDAVVETVVVGDNPNSFQLDAEGNIWVASHGAIVYNDDWSIDEENSTKGSISKITPNNSETLRLEMSYVTLDGATALSVSPDGQTLYYLFDGTPYAISSTAASLPSSPFISRVYYGLAVDPANGNIIGTVAPNFSSAGSIEVMTTEGNVIGTYTAGIGPSGIAFK